MSSVVTFEDRLEPAKNSARSSRTGPAKPPPCRLAAEYHCWYRPMPPGNGRSRFAGAPVSGTVTPIWDGSAAASNRAAAGSTDGSRKVRIGVLRDAGRRSLAFTPPPGGPVSDAADSAGAASGNRQRKCAAPFASLPSVASPGSLASALAGSEEEPLGAAGDGAAGRLAAEHVHLAARRRICRGAGPRHRQRRSRRPRVRGGVPDLAARERLRRQQIAVRAAGVQEAPAAEWPDAVVPARGRHRAGG